MARMPGRQRRDKPMTKVVRDARPSMAVIGILNPIMRILLRSIVGRLVKPFALLEFSGRRSGRHYRIPTGIYRVQNATVVFTPAAWRLNFLGCATATVYHLGRPILMTGTLITDPAAVAQALQSVLDNGTPARLLGFDIVPNHQLTASDVAFLGRAMIQFRALDPVPQA